MPTREDPDMHIDVCLGCGRYYAWTQSLENLWREKFSPRPQDVMPQLCYNCMEKE